MRSFFRGFLLLCDNFTFKSFRSLVVPLKLRKFSLCKFFIWIYLQKVISEGRFLLSTSNFCWLERISLNYSSNLYFTWKLLNFCRFSCYIFLIDITFKLKEYELISDILRSFIGNELIMWWCIFLLLFRGRHQSLCNFVQLFLIGGRDREVFIIFTIRVDWAIQQFL